MYGSDIETPTRPIITSRLMREEMHKGTRMKEGISEVDKIMNGIESVLDTLGKSATVKSVISSRLCIPTERRRLCGIPAAPDRLNRLTEHFSLFTERMSESMQSIWTRLVDSGILEPPESMKEVFSGLGVHTKQQPAEASEGIPLQSVPILNRRQRRAAERMTT